jgi:imidazolonepropionase-like amidohydrolase
MITLSNAKLFDGSKMLPGRHSVTLDGNRITAVDAPAPAGARTIDLGGMTLMPGLITGHMHADIYKFSYGHNQAGIMVGTELPPAVLMAIAMRTCGVAIESGFTGFLGASCSHSNDAQLKIAMAEGIFQGPRIRACGHHISANAGINDHPKWWLRTELVGQDWFASGPAEMRKLVREDIRRGAQTIKIFATAGHGFPGGGESMRDMARDEIAAVIDAAHERGAIVRAHVGSKKGIKECIELGLDIVDHGDNVDEECIELMAKNGTYWVPSIFNMKIMLQLGYGDTALIQREYDQVKRMLPIAQKAGVKILAGDDYFGIYREVLEDDPLDHKVGNYARELPFYAEMDGLNPTDVLTWATKNPGELLAEGGAKVGVVEAGAIADLIVVDGDPVADLNILSKPQKHLKAVIRDGAFLIDRLPAEQKRLAAE